MSIGIIRSDPRHPDAVTPDGRTPDGTTPDGTTPDAGTPQAVTLVGGGEIGADDIALALALAPILHAADSGAGAALAAGHMPDLVVGDFDSIAPADASRIPPARRHHVAEQDSTDFEKALGLARAPFVIAVGFLGERVDHQLAVLNTLVRHVGPPVVVLGRRDVIFHLPSRVTLPLEPGERVSLFPLAQVRARSTGLEWPLDGLTLAPDGRVGTSNRATGEVTVDPDAPGLLCLLERGRLGDVVAALSSRPDAASLPPA